MGYVFELVAREGMLKLLSDELKRLKRDCKRNEQSLKRPEKLCVTETQGMLDQQAQLKSLTDVAAAALKSAKGRAFGEALPTSKLERAASSAFSTRLCSFRISSLAM